MEEYQKLVIIEADELDYKITKLEDFLRLPPININIPELNRLQRQADAMRLYSYILHNRIKHFNNGKEHEILS